MGHSFRVTLGRRFTSALLLGISMLAPTAALGEELSLYRLDAPGQIFPTFQTKPFTMAPHDQAYYRELFETMTKLVLTKVKGQPILVLALRMLRNADDADVATCGTGLIGEIGPIPRKDILFAYTHHTLFVGFGWDAWRKLGCQTSGGMFIVSKVKSGSHDLYFVASQDSDPQGVPPPPANPPNGPLPLAARMEILSDIENSLSQALGAEVTIFQDHMYDEQDGTTTTCIVGAAERKRFRMVQSKGDLQFNPSAARWLEAGCTRPGYRLIH